MGLWNAPLDLKSADFLVHFGNHFGWRRNVEAKVGGRNRAAQLVVGLDVRDSIWIEQA